jgi:hypothetical protein
LKNEKSVAHNVKKEKETINKIITEVYKELKYAETAQNNLQKLLTNNSYLDNQLYTSK